MSIVKRTLAPALLGAMLALTPSTQAEEPQSGGKVTYAQTIDIFRFDSAGKIVEHWVNYDTMGIMQQIGAGPA